MQVTSFKETNKNAKCVNSVSLNRSLCDLPVCVHACMSTSTHVCVHAGSDEKDDECTVVMEVLI